MNKLNDDEVITGIRNKDRKVFEYLYKSYYYDVRGWLMKSISNNEDAARDIFQDAIIAIYIKVSKDGFELRSGFKTYLLSIINKLIRLKYRNEYTANLIKVSKYDKEKFESKLGNTDEILLEDRMISEMKINLFRRKFKELPDDCKKILKRFFDEVALRKIAKTLGYKSENYVKKRKYLCKEYLKNKIEEDIYYKIIKEHEDI